MSYEPSYKKAERRAKYRKGDEVVISACAGITLKIVVGEGRIGVVTDDPVAESVKDGPVGTYRWHIKYQVLFEWAASDLECEEGEIVSVGDRVRMGLAS